MSNLPTAEEFLDFDPRISTQYSDEMKTNVICRDDVELAMIEFAKLHVEAALKVAAENADTKCKKGHSGEFNEHWSVDKSSILNAYPLENIK